MDVPVTPFDTAQTGLKRRDLQNARVAVDVLKECDSLLAQGVNAVVAQNARYEAAIIRRFALAAPRLAALPFFDTVLLAKRVVPGLADYRLDTLATHLRLTIPVQRHRALPDVQLTANLLVALIALGQRSHVISNFSELALIADIEKPKRQTSQGMLFDV